MDTYTKLFGTILQSTVWQEPLPTKVVWITMLALSDKDGYVGASVPGLAKAAGVTLEECLEALQCFHAPDEWSRTQESEGRRIKAVDGGWMLLNHAKYRDLRSSEERRETNRRSMAAWRERKKKEAAK